MSTLYEESLLNVSRGVKNVELEDNTSFLSLDDNWRCSWNSVMNSQVLPSFLGQVYENLGEIGRVYIKKLYYLKINFFFFKRAVKELYTI